MCQGQSNQSLTVIISRALCNDYVLAEYCLNTYHGAWGTCSSQVIQFWKGALVSPKINLLIFGQIHFFLKLKKDYYGFTNKNIKYDEQKKHFVNTWMVRI